MAKATLKFDFENEFKGTVLGEAKNFQIILDGIKSRPKDFIECSWDIERVRAEADVIGEIFVIKLFFTILFTDDKELLSDGSYTRDMVSIWENDFPLGELTLTIGDQALSPVTAKCVHVH